MDYGNTKKKTNSEGAYYSTCFESVHTTPDKFENTALFLRLDLTSTLISVTKTLGFHFHGKRSFLKTMVVTIIPDRVFLKHKSKPTSDCCLVKFLLCSVDAKHLMRFQFHRSSVNRALYRSSIDYDLCRLTFKCFQIWYST